MVKKVFAIIGIVTGSVLAFAGAVFGVLALMGKFKTPDVFPDKLEFVTSEQRVVDVYNDDKEIYSFTLTGTNSKEEFKEFDVNKTECYIWFADDVQNSEYAVGSKIITLCDKNGNPLKAENNKYKVNCNSPIYYKIINYNSLLVELETKNNEWIANGVDNPNGLPLENYAQLKAEYEAGKLLDGKVMLVAQDVNNNAKSNTLTLWVDKQVGVIGLTNGDDDPTFNPDSKQIEQSLTLGTDIQCDISYLVDPENSLTPISKESEKAVELYFDDPNDDKADYILVTKTEIDKANSTLNKIMGYRTDANQKTQFYFKSLDSYSQGYKFIISVFKTYDDKQEFDAYIEENGADLTNYEKLELLNSKQQAMMAQTVLTVRFVNSSIKNIELSNTNIVLDLYKDNEIYINHPDKITNNLGLKYLNDQDEPTNVRYNEIQFGVDISTNCTNVTDHTQLKIKNIKLEGEVETVDKVFEEEDLNSNSFIDYLNKTQIYIDSDRTYEIIESLTITDKNNDEQTYVFTDGVLVTDGTNYKLLRAGTYFNFYVKQSDNSYKLPTTEEFDHERSNKVGNGAEAYWTITSKSEFVADEGEELYLGVICINPDGVFNKSNFFVTASVTVQSVDLDLTNLVSNSRETLEINYEDNSGAPNCDSVGFKEIIPENKIVGTYTSLAFIVKDTNSLEVVKNASGEEIAYTIDGETYYIVGSATWNEDGTIKDFSNSIAVKSGAISEAELKLVQFKNTFDETGDSFIKSEIIEKNKTDLTTYVEKLTESTVLTIYPKQMLNENNIVIKQGETQVEEVIEYFERTSNHTLTIALKDGILAPNDKMLENICNYYDIEDAVESSNPSNLTITNVSYAGNKITITFDISTYLTNNANVTISLKGLSGDESNFTIATVKIKKSSPDNIVYRFDEGEPITLFKDATEADVNSQTSIILNISGNDFTSSAQLNSKNITLNALVGNGTVGFGDKDGFKVAHEITYSSNDEGIFKVVKNDGEDFYTLVPISQGKAVLTVTFAGVSKCIVVKVTNDGKYSYKLAGDSEGRNLDGTSRVFEKQTTSNFTLNDIFTLYYNGNNITTINSTNGVVLKDVSVGSGSYGNGEVTKTIGDNGEIIFKDGETEVLKIYENADKWTFTRANNQYIPITVEFTVQTKVGEVKIVLTIKSNVEISFNANFWKEKTIYAGTNVLVYDSAKNAIETNPIIKILGVESSDDVKVEYRWKGSSSVVSGKTQTFENISGLDFDIYIKNVKVQTIGGFAVVPNAVVTAEVSKSLESNSSYNVTDLVTIKAFETSNVYGTKIYGTEGYCSYYDADGKINPTIYVTSDITVSDDNNLKDEHYTTQNLITSNANEISVGWLKIANDVKTTNLIIKYNGVSIYELENVTISNKYKISVIEGKTELYSLVEYNLSEILSGYGDLTINSIIFNGAECITDGKLKIPAISEVYENATIKFEFENDYEKIITFEAQFTISPYLPAINQREVLAGRQQYDLRTYFDDKDDKVEISVDGVYSAETEGEEITSNFFTNYDFNESLVVDVKDIVGNEKTVYVEFVIKYDENNSYTVRKPLIIKNQQTITVNYPEKGYEYNESIERFKFTEGTPQDIGLNGVDVGGGLYDLTEFTYEPVQVSTKKITSINLNYDRVLDVNRIIVSGTSNSSFEVELVAYSNINGFNTYTEAVNISGTIIELPTASQGTFGKLIFKITSNTNYYTYYIIHVFCASETYETNEVKHVNSTIANATSTEDIVGLLGINNKDTFNGNIFGKDYSANKDNIHFYITSATALGSAENYVVSSHGRYEELDLSTKLTFKDSTKYITLIISAVYRGETVDVYRLGTIYLYLQPTTCEETSVSADGVESITQTHNNGVYDAIIDANTTEIKCPFVVSDVTVTISNLEIEQKGNKISNSGSTITLERVYEDYEFTATYTYNNGLVLVVNYLYKATTLPESQTIAYEIGSATVREDTVSFATEYAIITDTQKASDNYKNANEISLLGSYNGEIKIKTGKNETTDEDIYCVFSKTQTSFKALAEDGEYSKVQYKYDTDHFVLNFIQTDSAYSIPLTFSYAGLGERTFIFKVKAGYHVAEESQAGLNAGNRLTTTSKETYDSAVGSTITITKNADNNYFTINNTGLKIYNVDSLKVSFSDAYVLNSGGTTMHSGEMDISNTTTINFVHLASVKNMTMTVKAYHADNLTNPCTTRTIYLSVQPTYSNIKAVYKTVGADHENVAGGSEITCYDLFGNISEAITSVENDESIFNSCRFELLDSTGDEIEIPTGKNFDSLGFNMEGNPNKLIFNCTADSVGGTFNSDKTELTFASVTSKADFCLLISNEAGVTNVAYNLQIMPNAVDSINYEEADGVIGENDNVKYISYTDLNQDLTIGKVKDTLNYNSFFVTKLKDGTETNDLYDKGDFNEEDYKSYSTNDGLTVKFNKTTREITCNYSGALVDGAQKVYTISIYGNADYLVQNLKLVFTNMSIASIHTATSRDETVYADYYVGLESKFKVYNAEGKTEINNSGLSYTLLKEGESSFKPQSASSSATTYISADSNSLFSYNQSKTAIQFNSVGENINADLKFMAVYGGYNIQEVEYKLTVFRNLQFVVNGADLLNSLNANLETNFYQTKGSYNVGASIVSKTDLESTYSSYKDGNNYAVLVLDLYKIKDQYDSSATEEDLRQPTTEYSITYSNEDESSIYSINGNTIKFKQDYSGDINLKLTSETSNGDYVQIWTINVTPLIGMEQKSSSPLLDGDAVFKSGSEVNIITGSSSSIGAGVVLTRVNKFYKEPTPPNTIPVEPNSKIVDLTVTYSANYFVNNDEDMYVDKTLFKKGEKIVSVDSKTLGADSLLKINLPNVPVTLTGSESYIVVYELVFKYNSDNIDSQIERTFYVAYEVINQAQVTAYEYKDSNNLNHKSASIDLDTRLEDTTKLDLFYYAVNYTYTPEGGATDTIALTLGKEGDNYKYIFLQGDTELLGAVYDETNDTITYDGNTYSKASSDAVLTYHVETTGGTEPKLNRLSVLNSSFAGIKEFKAFMESIDAIKFEYSSVSDTADDLEEVYFKLIYIENGRFGIDLNERFKTSKFEDAEGYNADTDKKTKAFINNELCCNLHVVSNDVNIVTIYKYPSVNNSGFRLYTTNMLTPAATKTFKVGKIFMAEEVTPAENYTLEDILNLDVLGVTNDNTALQGWVTGAQDNGNIAENAIATIKVATGAGYTEYTLHPVTYTGTASGAGSSLYNLNTIFYVIKSGNGKIVVRDYSAVSKEITFFRVGYVEGNVNQSLDNSTGAFGYYAMDGNVLKYNIVSNISATYTIDSEVQNKTKISIESTKLIEYKSEHPTETYYETITAVVQVIEGVSVQADVKFVLPEFQTKQVTYNSSGMTATVNFGDNKTFGNNNLTDVKSVVVDSEFANYVDTTSSYYNSSTGEITLKVGQAQNPDSGIAYYFEKNTSATHLKIKFVMTLNDNTTYTFYVVVIKA